MIDGFFQLILNLLRILSLVILKMFLKKEGSLICGYFLTENSFTFTAVQKVCKPLKYDSLQSYNGSKIRITLI